MKVVIVGPVPPHMSGIAHCTRRLADALHDRVDVLDIITWKAQYPRFIYRGQQPSGKVRPADARWLLRWWDPFTWREARRLASDADLLVLPWVTPFHALAYNALLKRTRARAVGVIHNMTPHETFPFSRLLTGWIVRKLDGAVAHSETVAKVLREFRPGIDVRVVGLPPTLDVVPTPLPPHPPLRLLFFGLVRPYKGLDIALEAMRILRRQGADVYLTVAGDFWDPVDRWFRKIDAMGIAATVELLPGYVPDDEVQNVLDRHHLLVAPYQQMTQSGVVPLALAAGRPVVATTIGSTLVSEGVNGTTSEPPDDPQAFAAAIRRAGDALEQLASRCSSPRSWGHVADAVLSFASDSGTER